MQADGFTKRLKDIQRKRSSIVCVGLDPDPSRLPPHLLDRYTLPDAVIAFATRLIESTAAMVCAFKLNLAFFEVLEDDMWRVLRETLDAVPDDVAAIADGKRGDIGNSARFYARSVFDHLPFDACTVSSYMGKDSVEAFLQYEGRGVLVLVRTSNPGGADFQTLSCGDERFYERVARTSASWATDAPGEIGFVMGASDVEALSRVRSRNPSVPLLIPGIGAQGGDASAVIEATREGTGPIVVNSSRSIIYASSEKDFADAAGRAAASLRDTLEKYRR